MTDNEKTIDDRIREVCFSIKEKLERPQRYLEFRMKRMLQI